MPSTSSTLAMFDPTTLPSASPGAPSRMAWTLTSNSGADVPKATTVRLTTSAGMPSRRARFTAPFTSASPAKIRMTRPSATLNRSIDISQVFPQGQGARPTRGAPQWRHLRERARRAFPGKRRRPNIASTAIPIRKRVMILTSIQRPNRAQPTRASSAANASAIKPGTKRCSRGRRSPNVRSLTSFP